MKLAHIRHYPPHFFTMTRLANLVVSGHRAEVGLGHDSSARHLHVRYSWRRIALAPYARCIPLSLVSGPFKPLCHARDLNGIHIIYSGTAFGVVPRSVVHPYEGLRFLAWSELGGEVVGRNFWFNLPFFDIVIYIGLCRGMDC